jgi:toxin ParE1/3/4
MRLRLSVEAGADIYHIHEYGALNYGLAQADRYLAHLNDMLDFLARYPFSARERHDLRPSVRVGLSGAHNIIYRILADEVLVVRVLHHSAQWQDWI